MADFCKQCSEELGFKNQDLVGLISEAKFKAGYVAIALCEGCGGGEFGPDGACQGHCMNKSHNPKT